jgi:hypothetical protein
VSEPADYRAWKDLEEDDRNIIRKRIANGELSQTFRVGDHVYYVGHRLPYLSPKPITRALRPE